MPLQRALRCLNSSELISLKSTRSALQPLFVFAGWWATAIGVLAALGVGSGREGRRGLFGFACFEKYFYVVTTHLENTPSVEPDPFGVRGARPQNMYSLLQSLFVLFVLLYFILVAVSTFT